MRYIGVLAALAFVLAAAGNALALPWEPTSEDLPGFYYLESEEANSWAAIFVYAPAVGEGLSHLQARIIPNGLPAQCFTVPPLSLAAWTDKGTLSPDKMLFWASGPQVGAVVMTIGFQYRDGPYAPLVDPPFYLQLQGYYNDPANGMVLRANQEFYFNGTKWIWYLGGINFPASAPGMGDPSGTFSGQAWLQSSPIPEPVTMAGLMLGLGCLGRYIRRRR